MMPRTFTQTPCEKKRYYARVAGSRFCFDDGSEIYFLHGFADVAILEHQKELDAIIGKNPNIYLPDKLPEALPEVKQNALSEAELTSAERALAGVTGKTAQDIGPVSDQAGKPSDPNASTVDADLQAAVFGKSGTLKVGPGAAKNAIQPISTEQIPVTPAAASVSR